MRSNQPQYLPRIRELTMQRDTLIAILETFVSIAELDTAGRKTEAGLSASVQGLLPRAKSIIQQTKGK